MREKFGVFWNCREVKWKVKWDFEYRGREGRERNRGSGETEERYGEETQNEFGAKGTN